LRKLLNNGHILGAAAFLALPLEIVSWPSVTPVMVVAAVGLIAFGGWRSALPPWWLAVLCAALVAWGAASALWSLDARSSLKVAAELLGTFAAGLVCLGGAHRLEPREREFCEKSLVVGFLLGLAILEFMFLTRARIIDYVRELPTLAPIIGHQRPFYFPVGFDTSMSLISLLVWPVTGIALRRWGKIAGVAVLALPLAIVWQGESDASKAAYIASVLIFGAALLAPRAATWAMAAFLALWIAAAPVLLRPELFGWLPQALPVKVEKQASLAHRLGIWQFTSVRIGERPLFGWGLDSARIIPGGHEILGTRGEAMPLHPHDEALQLRLDLGVPGVLLGLGFLSGLFHAIRARWDDRVGTAVTLALVSSASLFAAISYNLWHVWWLTMVWLAGSFMAAFVGARADERSGVAFDGGRARALGGR
jgi:O-antigen ligase